MKEKDEEEERRLRGEALEKSSPRRRTSSDAVSSFTNFKSRGDCATERNSYRLSWHAQHLAFSPPRCDRFYLIIFLNEGIQALLSIQSPVTALTFRYRHPDYLRYPMAPDRYYDLAP